jgi:hypothetical protein
VSISPDLRFDWFAYGNTPRPARIGDTLDGVRLGELEDEMQDVISSYFAGDGSLDVERRDRLALAQAATQRILPSVPDDPTRTYLASLARLAGKVLDRCGLTSA